MDRVSDLGFLYDERTDSFLSYSILNFDLQPNMVKLVDNSFTDTDFFISTSINQKFKILAVEAQLKLSVLSGLFELQGSGKYLKDEKETFRSVSADLIFKSRSVYQSVDITKIREDKKIINIQSLQNGGATHVVVGIQWGANAVGSLVYENRDREDKLRILFKYESYLKSMNNTYKSMNHT